VYSGYWKLLRARSASPAFHPNGGQKVLFSHPAVFTLLRTSPDGGAHVLCLHNVSGQSHLVSIDADGLPGSFSESCVDALSGSEFSSARGKFDMMIAPYQVLWLQPVIR